MTEFLIGNEHKPGVIAGRVSSLTQYGQSSAYVVKAGGHVDSGRDASFIFFSPSVHVGYALLTFCGVREHFSWAAFD